MLVKERLKKIPYKVGYILGGFDSWLVGGGARYLIGEENEVKDWDLIINPFEWLFVHNTFIHYGKLEINRYGGHKFIGDDGVEIDYWPSSLSDYFCNINKNTEKAFAVKPYINKVIRLVG